MRCQSRDEELFCAGWKEFDASDDAIEKGRMGLVCHRENKSCLNCEDCLVVDREQGRRV